MQEEICKNKNDESPVLNLDALKDLQRLTTDAYIQQAVSFNNRNLDYYQRKIKELSMIKSVISIDSVSQEEKDITLEVEQVDDSYINLKRMLDHLPLDEELFSCSLFGKSIECLNYLTLAYQKDLVTLKNIMRSVSDSEKADVACEIEDNMWRMNHVKKAAVLSKETGFPQAKSKSLLMSRIISNKKEVTHE